MFVASASESLTVILIDCFLLPYGKPMGKVSNITSVLQSENWYTEAKWLAQGQ